MNAIQRRRIANRKRKIRRRLAKRAGAQRPEPMFSVRNVQYEVAERSHGMGQGGIGAFHLLARKLGLIQAIDDRLELLKVHLPYHESDHVLNIAYNNLSGGTRLEDIELRRSDEVYLDALGAQRIPDPTTAGDFCRRFSAADIMGLQAAFDQTRLRVWRQQPAAFFAEAVLDLDGSLVGTSGRCKRGTDIAYDGTWGYHPLVLSLANTGEVLRILNRSGNRPSHEGAAAQVDAVLALCWRAGFRRVLLRGDTDFSRTQHLDRWSDDPRVRFVFGIDAMPNLVASAEDLPPSAWRPLPHRSPPPRKSKPRQRPEDVKSRIVREREYKNLRPISEGVAALDYQPTACRKSYRLVIVRKNISVEKGEAVLFEEIRYFFFITNDRERRTAEIVLVAHGRCDQENLIAQLKGGVRALVAPLDTPESNWAYMVMAGLAWSLKAWWALQLPERPGRWAERHRTEKRTLLRMEFKTFVNSLVRLPCQIVRSGRRIIYRLLGWNPWQHVFFRVLDALRC